MAKDRLSRVNELLHRELGEVFTAVVSPDLPILVTVTGVEVSIDLRDATVYVSVYGNEAQKQRALTFLEKKRVLIQSRVSRKIILKYTPVLHFKLDDTADRAAKVDEIIRELDAEDQAKNGAEEAPTAKPSAPQETEPSAPQETR